MVTSEPPQVLLFQRRSNTPLPLLPAALAGAPVLGVRVGSVAIDFVLLVVGGDETNFKSVRFRAPWRSRLSGSTIARCCTTDPYRRCRRPHPPWPWKLPVPVIALQKRGWPRPAGSAELGGRVEVGGRSCVDGCTIWVGVRPFWPEPPDSPDFVRCVRKLKVVDCRSTEEFGQLDRGLPTGLLPAAFDGWVNIVAPVAEWCSGTGFDQSRSSTDRRIDSVLVSLKSMRTLSSRQGTERIQGSPQLSQLVTVPVRFGAG